MPELPDVECYVRSLERHAVGKRIDKVTIKGISTLASYDPPVQAIEGGTITRVRRLGKRIVLDLGDDLRLVIHLMIAGRLRRWNGTGKNPPGGKHLVATICLEDADLVLTEVASKKRARIWVMGDEASLLEAHDRGGIEPVGISVAELSGRLTEQNRTLKRALTDPRALSGIGNAYSDEILHRARLAPTQRTRNLDRGEWEQLQEAIHGVLTEWTARLVDEVGDGFPDKVTAFRPEMAVHGKFGQPCPVCSAPVQRIVRGDHETNYCPRCQTGGRILADRSLSKILKDDWPSTLDDLDDA